MRKVAIVSDDTCDLPKEFLLKYDLTLVPTKVIFSDKVFSSCGVTGELSLEEYYARAEHELPSTSTPFLGMISECLKNALEKAESVICIFLSKYMSPIATNAQTVVNQQFPNRRIKVFDSNVASVGLAAIVIEAARLAHQGESFDEINTKIERWIQQVHFAGIMFTLENLVRTGRVPKTKKFMADFFKVKPIVKLIDGQVSVQGKIRANDAVIINQMKKFSKLALENLNNESDYLFIGHTRWITAAEEIASYLRKHNPMNKQIIIQETGAIVANFVGKKTLTLGYLGEYNEKWLLNTKN